MYARHKDGTARAVPGHIARIWRHTETTTACWTAEGASLFHAVMLVPFRLSATALQDDLLLSMAVLRFLLSIRIQSCAYIPRCAVITCRLRSLLLSCVKTSAPEVVKLLGCL